MTDSFIDENDIKIPLLEIGMEKDRVEDFMKNLYLENDQGNKKILTNYRIEILENIRKEQERLYCFDYLVRELKRKLKENKK